MIIKNRICLLVTYSDRNANEVLLKLDNNQQINMLINKKT